MLSPPHHKRQSRYIPSHYQCHPRDPKLDMEISSYLYSYFNGLITIECLILSESCTSMMTNCPLTNAIFFILLPSTGKYSPLFTARLITTSLSLLLISVPIPRCIKQLS